MNEIKTRWTVEDVLLSEHEPYAASASPSGRDWQAGARMVVYYDLDKGWGYRFYGVNYDGNTYQGEDITGFASPLEAIKNAARWLNSLNPAYTARLREQLPYMR